MFDYFLLSCCLPPALSLQLGSKKRDVYQRCDKCDTVYTCKFWDYLAPLGLASPSTLCDTIYTDVHYFIIALETDIER